MKKCVHTIVIDNWFPSMCAITLPLLRAYAQRIGADFNIISKTKFPDFPPNYEKMQIYELGKDYDWNIYIDADMVVDPEKMPDFTLQDPKFFYYESRLLDLNTSYSPHQYFLRDGRNFGVSDCFLVTSKLNHDLWTPTDMSFFEAKKYCKLGGRAVSEFAINLNIAKFALEGWGSIGPDKNHFHLQTTDDRNRPWNGGKENMTKEEHIERAKEIVRKMGIPLETAVTRSRPVSNGTRKAVFTVVVDNYMPELCAKTLPTIRAYADKIGAEHIIISERKYPDFPPTYEKVQIHELGGNYDFCILIDADFFVHPDAPDFTLGISPGYVGVLEAFNADNLFEKDEYFIKDGRNIGLVTSLVITDRVTHKVWEPLEMTWEQAREKTKREFIIDEYCLSHNLAKYGLKFTGLNYNDDIKKLFYHIGATTK